MMLEIKVYAAGKIAPDDWRNVRNSACNAEEWAEAYARGGPVATHDALNAVVFYVGPYFISCDHGCLHGTNSHGVAASSSSLCADGGADAYRVTANCLDAIDRCDVFYLRIDDDGAYGSMVEVGYALRAGKPFVVAVVGDRSDYWFARVATQFCGPTALVELAIRRTFPIGQPASWDR